MTAERDRTHELLLACRRLEAALDARNSDKAEHRRAEVAVAMGELLEEFGLLEAARLLRSLGMEFPGTVASCSSDTWSARWPTEPGWYWVWEEGRYHRLTSDPVFDPVEVFLAGAAGKEHPVYVRRGHFLYRAEQASRVLWWIPMRGLPSRAPDFEDACRAQNEEPADISEPDQRRRTDLPQRAVRCLEEPSTRSEPYSTRRTERERARYRTRRTVPPKRLDKPEKKTQ